MFNTVAFYASVANGASLTNLTPVTDPLVTVTANNRLIFPDNYQVGAAQVIIPNGTRARLNTPSMRLIALPEIYPIVVGTTQPTNPPIMGPSWGDIMIPKNDEVGIDVSRGGAAAGDVFGALWVGPKMDPAPNGPVYTMRCTATTTLTLGTWVANTLTFDQTLPYGKYAVVGMVAQGTNLIFARLTFPGQTQYRPGVPGNITYGDYVNPQVFRLGNFGLFGVFDSTAQPGAEFLGLAAGSQSQVVLLDLVKVG